MLVKENKTKEDEIYFYLEGRVAKFRSDRGEERERERERERVE
jgi:hypothetical protein